MGLLIPKLHVNERLIGISQFYMVNLLWGMLDKNTESNFIDYIINNPNGIYFIYEGCISEVPPKFDSLQTSKYIAALECLSGYRCASQKLGFAVEWIESCQIGNRWDLGVYAKDGVYFPISDSWRKDEYRKKDCTERIAKLLNKIV